MYKKGLHIFSLRNLKTQNQKAFVQFNFIRCASDSAVDRGQAYLKSANKMPSSLVKKCNPDIEKERRSATFDVEEFASWWCGGPEELKKKRELGKIIMEHPDMIDDYPYYYMSYKEMYNNCIKRVHNYAKILKQLQKERNPGGTDIFPGLMYGEISNSINVQGNPLDLHLLVFVPAITSHGTPEQVAKWLPRAMNFEIIGTYAQTELGHGTFVRGLETRADYDPKTEEFILNTPTLSAYKWWPGGLGHTVNYSVVMAQLYTNNKCHGVQMFLVQLRDEETHMPLPGITIGDIGNKMALQTVNNGYLGFKDFRIPRMNMMMRNAKVLPDGTFEKSPVSVLTYLTMTETRVAIVLHSSWSITQAATIATRYSAVRRQGVIDPNGTEVQILDRVTQQMKLFPEIAVGILLHTASKVLKEMFSQVNQEILQQKYERLPEMHALTCCLKAVSTKDAKHAAETLRLACGGHGFMLASKLPIIDNFAAAAPTYEGENTVLLLQTARFLMKSWDAATNGEELVPTVAYLKDALGLSKFSNWDGTSKSILKALQFATANKIRATFSHLEDRKRRMTREEADNLTGLELAEVGELHGRVFLAAVAVEQVEKLKNQLSPQLYEVLKDLLELYLICTARQNKGVILEFIPLTEADLAILEVRLETALAKIRPNAVAIVDGFDYHDRVLNSVLGCYDGNVYERIFEVAQRCPMNTLPVQQSFEEHLKPFMKAKL